jgi:porin
MSTKPTLWSVMFACPILLLAGPSTGVDLTLESFTALRGAAHGTGLHGLAILHSGLDAAETTHDRPLWSGYASLLAISGRGPTERFLGDFLAASNIEGHDSLRLYTWWLETNRGAWSVRAGALLADEEFTGTDAGSGLLNSAFGWPAFISANTVNTGPAFYVAAPGVRLAHTWSDGTTWRLGVYDGDAFDSPTGDPHLTRHGMHYRIGDDQGWFVISEATFSSVDRLTRLAVGAWLHTADFDDLTDDDAGQPFLQTGNAPRRHALNYGAYASGQHTLAGTPGEAGNLEFFVRGGVSPGDRNTLGWALDTGLGWTGPLPGRPGDVLTIGVAHARFGSGLIRAARMTAPGDPAPDFEQVIEIGYTATLSEHLSLQPDLQYIRHPGGSTVQRDACVFLLRLNASY